MVRGQELSEAGLPRRGSAVRSVFEMPCTGNRTRLCKLLNCLPACNNILWHAGLHLKENERGNLGDLSVAMVTDSCSRFARGSSDAGWKKCAEDLLHRLFTVHSCIVAVDLNYIIASSGLLLTALAKMRSLKRLSISGIPSDKPSITDRLGDLVRSLYFIEELSLDGYWPSQATTALPVLLLEREGIALTTLDVAALEISAPLVRHLTAALIRNNTVTELSVGACIFSFGQARCSEWFAEYLLKENGTLRKLTLRAPPFRSRPGLETIVAAICRMKTLEELIADWKAASEVEYTLFSKVVAQNKRLRSLSMPCSESGGDVMATARHAECFAAIGRKDTWRPWLQALKSNHKLLELTIDLQWLSLIECRAFFKAVSKSKTLKTVTVRYLTDDWNLKQICLVIREFGLERKVLIQNHHLGHINLESILECPEATTVILSCPHLAKAEHFGNAFNILASCRHVTSLCVHYEDFCELVYVALAAYIRGSSALKNVELYLPGDLEMETLCEEFGKQRCACGTSLLKALAANLFINKVALELPRLSFTDCEAFANAVVESACLYQLSLSTVAESFCTVFLHYLLPKVEQNYTLLRVELHDGAQCGAEMAVVQDVARRNSSLVNRAACFVTGDYDVPYCARSFEFVSQHPKLFEVVQSKAAVDEAEARKMIRRTLNRVRLADLDDYMRLSGVVRHRVVCQAPAFPSCVTDSGKQLDELKYECWLHIRKYLKLVDVVEPPELFVEEGTLKDLEQHLVTRLRSNCSV